MSMHWGRRLQYAAACVLVIAYASLSHYCNSAGPLHPGAPADGVHTLGAALALAPLTVVSLVMAWRWTPPVAAMLLTVALAALLYNLRPLLEHHFSLFYLVQESSVYGLLGLSFSRSLTGHRVAVCTHLADKVHGPLSPREVWYTRHVTAAWAGFFFLVAAVSLLLFAAAPLRIWSIYINFCVMPLVGAMFIGEYLVRRRVLPQVARAGLLATVRVYFASPQ